MATNPCPTSCSLGKEEKEVSPIDQRSAVEQDLVELLLHDSEEYHREQRNIRLKIEEHQSKYGGDVSLLLQSKTIPISMKCITLKSFGPSKNIHTTRIPLVLPVKNEVLIRSYSCGVNFQDVMARQGLLDSWVRSRKPPYTMGSEVAGQVIAIGSSVTDLKVGDRVVALPEFQAWCEYPICPAAFCYKIPDDMNYHDAVAITGDGIVAYTLLFELGALRPGKCILIHSAPGGLGHMVSQMAKTVPNVQLFNIAAGSQEESETTSVGTVHYIDRRVDYASEIRRVSPMGVDLVLDCQCEDNFHKDYNLLKPLGKYILYGTQSAVTGESRGFFGAARAWWGIEKISPLKLYEDNKTICGFNLRHLLYFQRQYKCVQNIISKVFELWKVGAIKPEFDCVLHFDDHAEGLQRMLDHGRNGKIILDPIMSREDNLHIRDYLIPEEKLKKLDTPENVAPQKMPVPSSSLSSEESYGVIDMVTEGTENESVGRKSKESAYEPQVIKKTAETTEEIKIAENKDVLSALKEVEREIEKSYEMEEVENEELAEAAEEAEVIEEIEEIEKIEKIEKIERIEKTETAESGAKVVKPVKTAIKTEVQATEIDAPIFG